MEKWTRNWGKKWVDESRTFCCFPFSGMHFDATYSDSLHTLHLHPRWRTFDANFESFEFFALRTHLKLRLCHANIFVLVFVLFRDVLLVPSTISLQSAFHVSPSVAYRQRVGGDFTHVNILFDLFEYKPSRPCATVTFSSGNTKSGSNAEAAPAVHGWFGIVCAWVGLFFYGFLCVGFPSSNAWKIMFKHLFNIAFFRALQNHGVLLIRGFEKLQNNYCEKYNISNWVEVSVSQCTAFKLTVGVLQSIVLSRVLWILITSVNLAIWIMYCAISSKLSHFVRHPYFSSSI